MSSSSWFFLFFSTSITCFFLSDFVLGDLRDPKIVSDIIPDDLDELYQFAADMGGAGFVFTGENDADIMHNSAMINLNVVEKSVKIGVKKIFYSFFLYLSLQVYYCLVISNMQNHQEILENHNFL